MPINADRLRRLSELGLSEYCGRAYLALLDLGSARAGEISALSKVPPGKIYAALERLHEHGLVRIAPEFPKRYSPVPIATYLSRLQEEHRGALARLERDGVELSHLFAVEGTSRPWQAGSFEVLHGRRRVMTAILDLLDSATREWLLLASPGMAGRMRPYAQELAKARARGAAVQVVVAGKTASAAAAPLLGVNLPFESHGPGGISATPGLRVSAAIADGHVAVVAASMPDDESMSSPKDTGIRIAEESMVDFLRGLLFDPGAAGGARRER